MEELTCTLPGCDVLSMREEQLICNGRQAFTRCGADCQQGAGCLQKARARCHSPCAAAEEVAVRHARASSVIGDCCWGGATYRVSHKAPSGHLAALQHHRMQKAVMVSPTCRMATGGWWDNV